MAIFPLIKYCRMEVYIICRRWSAKGRRKDDGSARAKRTEFNQSADSSMPCWGCFCVEGAVCFVLSAYLLPLLQLYEVEQRCGRSHAGRIPKALLQLVTVR